MADLPAQRKVTLSDVARRAGVSPTTASYILNGRSEAMRIAPDTQRRVREAVAELGYRPNRTARSLRTSTTSSIGVVTDFVASGMFASRMLSGANAAARARDHILVIGETEGNSEVADLLIDEMLDRQVDGVIYVTRTTLSTPLPERLRGTRVVMLNCSDPETPVPCVLPDERGGGRLAAETLLAAGLDRDVWVVGQDPVPNAIAGPLRLAGIVEAFTEAGQAIAGVVPCDWSVAEAYAALSQWLDEGQRPRALICLNDRIAMGAYQALARHGLAVPDDVSVISFDGSELASWLYPHVSSVELPFAEMGRRAVDLVLDPESVPGSPILVPMPLIRGQSVAERELSGRA